MSDNKTAVAFDGWENLFTGVGVPGTDRRLASTFTSRSLMQEGELNQLYADNGFAKRVVDKHVEAMLQRGFKVDGDQDNDVLARFDELDVWTELERMLKWNRLHGGAIMVVGVDDGSPDLTRPLNESTVRNVLFLRTYDRWRVSVNRPIDIYDDPRSPKYGKAHQ